ncbi:MAG TPA: Ig-like domain-containing protein [Friedmanniella sp.]
MKPARPTLVHEVDPGVGGRPMTPVTGRRGRVLLLAALAAVVGLLGVLSAPAAGAATGPTAVDDAASVPVGQSVTLAGARNDRAGSAAIQPGLTVFPGIGQPGGSVVSDGGRTLKVAKHGTFSVLGDGSVTFSSWKGFTGKVTVRYRITDAAGATADGSLVVTVTANGALDDVLADFGTEVAVVDLLANDTPGRNADGTPGTLDRGSVRFADHQTWGGTVSDDGHAIVAVVLGTSIPLGVATLDDHGLLTWRAYPSSSDWGLSANVYYTARDTTVAADGTLEHHSYVAEVVPSGNPNTDPNRVRTQDDLASTPFDASVTLPGTLNDHSHDPSSSLVPGRSRFAVGDLAPDDYLAPDGRKLRYPGRGTWTIDPDGGVLYVPPRGFSGTDGVNLEVFDDQGRSGYEELVVVVEPGPTAKPDTVTVPPDVPTPVAVLANDVPGTNADQTAGSMDESFVRFPTDHQPSGATVSAYARTLTVPHQGVYTASRSTGTISFDPEPGFVGRASPVTYSARDTVRRTDGRVVHSPVTSTLTVQVEQGSR